MFKRTYFPHLQCIRQSPINTTIQLKLLTLENILIDFVKESVIKSYYIYSRKAYNAILETVIF